MYSWTGISVLACATLGSPSTTELTIRDDDPAPPVVPVVQPYALDPTFGTDGKASARLVFGSLCEAMTLQSNGKIVVVGGGSMFALARFNVDGTLDDSFGTDGIVTSQIDTSDLFNSEKAIAVAIQPEDQKIVAAGDVKERFSADPDVCVVRYEPGGRLDETFGTGGILKDVLPGSAKDVALQPDGRILVVGPVPGGSVDSFLARLLPDGQLDPSFGLDGRVIIRSAGRTNHAENLVVQPDGLIIVTGSSLKPDNQVDHQTDIARYQPDGQPDPTFGTGGTLTLDANVGADLIVQPDGRLVLVGTSDVLPTQEGNATAIAVMRLEPDGAVADTFGDHGVSLISVTDRKPSGGDGTALALQPDGRILVAGTSKGRRSDFIVARLRTDGTPDTDFTDTGTMLIDILGFGFEDAATTIASIDDDKILVAGKAETAGSIAYAVARIAPQTNQSTP